MARVSGSFRAALYDYYFLLGRGYPPHAASQLVAAGRMLGRRSRVLLARCVPAVRGGFVLVESVEGRCLAVDGFNQLAGIYALLRGEPLYRCLDGVVRDSLLAGADRVARVAGLLAPLLAAALLRDGPPSRVVVVFDSQPSRSGEAARAVGEVLRGALGGVVEVAVVRKADKTLVELAGGGCVVASSDAVVLRGARMVYDAVARVVLMVSRAQEAAVIDIPRLLRGEHRSWCSGGGLEGAGP